MKCKIIDAGIRGYCGEETLRIYVQVYKKSNTIFKLFKKDIDTIYIMYRKNNETYLNFINRCEEYLNKNGDIIMKIIINDIKKDYKITDEDIEKENKTKKINDKVKSLIGKEFEV